jgi:hypothetical protein
MKAKLIKKDSPKREQLERARKQRKSRAVSPPTPAKTALEFTTEWIKKRREESSGAREAFANLFADADPQSA